MKTAQVTLSINNLCRCVYSSSTIGYKKLL